MKAIVLFSGGLDSILATALLKDQGVEVVGVNVVTPFHDCSTEATQRANELGIKLIIRRFGDEYMRLLTHPQWGIGKGINPCIDCRIEMLRAAGEVMASEQADFVATGEVVGQRPNSQKMHQLQLIARESGLLGKLLRPLSAKHLSPTEMELNGNIDREKLRSFTGRCRSNLIGLAQKKYHITHIPQPSTGCLLCEKSFAPRIRSLLRFKPEATCWDAATLAAGRQLQIDSLARVVIGRRESDCLLLETLFSQASRSASAFLIPANFQGAAVLLVTPTAPSFEFKGNFDFPQEPLTSLSLPLQEELTYEEKLYRYLSIAGSLILGFTRKDKYEQSGSPPQARLRVGQEERSMPLFPSPLSSLSRFS